MGTGNREPETGRFDTLGHGPMATDATIIVVDDDELILVLMRRLLRQYGFTPIVVSSGEKALEQVASSAPDLILLDLGLQDVAGKEFMARLRQVSPLVPVVIVSGRSLSPGEVSKLGAADFLQKPFEIDALIGSIRRTLEAVAG